LIAKWYLGGPLTNSRRAKWSMDDMSPPPPPPVMTIAFIAFGEIM